MASAAQSPLYFVEDSDWYIEPWKKKDYTAEVSRALVLVLALKVPGRAQSAICTTQSVIPLGYGQRLHTHSSLLPWASCLFHFLKCKLGVLFFIKLEESCSRRGSAWF